MSFSDISKLFNVRKLAIRKKNLENEFHINISDLTTFCYFLQPSLCLWTVLSSYENYLKQLKTVGAKLKSTKNNRRHNENLLVTLQWNKRNTRIGGIIDIRRSTLTNMISAAMGYFIIMAQLFAQDPYK